MDRFYWQWACCGHPRWMQAKLRFGVNAACSPHARASLPKLSIPSAPCLKTCSCLDIYVKAQQRRSQKYISQDSTPYFAATSGRLGNPRLASFSTARSHLPRVRDIMVSTVVYVGSVLNHGPLLADTMIYFIIGPSSALSRIYVSAFCLLCLIKRLRNSLQVHNSIPPALCGNAWFTIATSRNEIFSPHLVCGLHPIWVLFWHCAVYCLQLADLRVLLSRMHLNLKFVRDKKNFCSCSEL